MTEQPDESAGEQPRGGPLDSGDVTAAITADLLRLERSGDRLTVEIGPWSAFMLVTSAQTIVTRMMRPGDELAGALREATAAIEQALEGTAAGAALAAGWGELRARGHRC